MAGCSSTVAVNAPALPGQRLAVDAVQVLQQRMGRQAGTEYGGDVVLGPADDVDERLPKRLLVQRRVRHVGSRNDHRVESLLPQVLEAAVITIDIGPRILVAPEFGERKRIDEELRNAVAAADEPDELALRCL